LVVGVFLPKAMKILTWGRNLIVAIMPGKLGQVKNGALECGDLSPLSGLADLSASAGAFQRPLFRERATRDCVRRRQVACAKR
jgi:hypothetical protein